MKLPADVPEPAVGKSAAREPLGHPEEAASPMWSATLALPPAALPDLLAAGTERGRRLWRRSELSLLGVGEALRLELAGPWGAPAHSALAGNALRRIHNVGHTGPVPGCTGPVAIGALPYNPAEPGHLVVPRLLLGRAGSDAWATVVGAGERAPGTDEIQAQVERGLAGLRAEDPAEEVPDAFDLSASMAHEDWKRLVAATLEAIAVGPVSKVVLARRVDVVANRPFALRSVLARLGSLYPSCAVFQVEGFLGASPETLVRRRGDQVLSHPLAGTVARSGDVPTDEAMLAALMASGKDRHEHQLVVGSIAAALAPLCAELEVPPVPSVVALRNVSHLGTPILGRLRAGNAGDRMADALELAARLHPTPAVGGEPTALAMQWQSTHEGFDRGLYAGPVGWLDGNGDGEWALGLRCATVHGNRASLYAGAGIVAGSDPDAELVETQLKLQALLAALVRP